MSDLPKKDFRQAAVFVQSGVDLSGKALVELVAAGDGVVEYQRQTAISEIDQAISQFQEAKDVLEGQNDV